MSRSEQSAIDVFGMAYVNNYPKWFHQMTWDKLQQINSTDARKVDPEH